MIWCPEKKISFLPNEIQGYFQAEARYLHRQLRENTLHVVLKEAPDPRHCGHMIRVVDSQNPDWYRTLYVESPRIRRYLAMPSLARIRDGKDGDFDSRTKKYVFDMKFRDLIFERLTDGYAIGRDYIYPDNTLRAFFELPPIECFSKNTLEEMCEPEIFPLNTEEDIPF